MEAQLLKFKRLLTMSRERLEENQRQLSDKTQAISLLTHENDTIKTQLSQQADAAAAATAALQQLQQQLQQQQQQQLQQQQKQEQQRQQRERGRERAGTPPVVVEAPPRRALLRVQQHNLIWVLFEKDDTPSSSSSSNNSSSSSNGDTLPTLNLAWKAFSSEADLLSYIARGPGQEPLILPPSCLSIEQSTRLSLEAQGKVDRLQEELRYVLHMCAHRNILLSCYYYPAFTLPPSLPHRVRSELAIRQKDAEINHLSAATLRSPLPPSLPPSRRKYRVRSELAMRQKDAEIKHLSAAALAAQQKRIDNQAPDDEELKRTVKAQVRPPSLPPSLPAAALVAQQKRIDNQALDDEELQRTVKAQVRPPSLLLSLPPSFSR